MARVGREWSKGIIHTVSLMPPCKWISDMFNVCAQVPVDLGCKIHGFGGSECWEIVKYITDLVITN